MADEQEHEEDGVKPGGMLSIAVFALLSMVGAVLGAVVGQQVMGEGFSRPPVEVAEERPRSQVRPLYDGGEVQLVRLTPVVTNLASPTETWIRIEAAVVLDAEQPEKDVLVSQISEDVLGYLRTLSLSELQGASGLRHLKEDLNERALIRGNEAVRELILESMVLQ